MMNKLTNKQKRSVKRRVELEQGVRPPGTRVFVSKKIYSRKLKHKKNGEKSENRFTSSNFENTKWSGN